MGEIGVLLKRSPRITKETMTPHQSPETRREPRSTMSLRSEPFALPLMGTHHRVGVITADVQRAICQVKSAKTAGSLRKGEGRTVRLKWASSAPTQRITHLQDGTESQIRYRMEVGREMMRKKIHDSCYKETWHRNCAYTQSPEFPKRAKTRWLKNSEPKTIHVSLSLSSRLPLPAPLTSAAYRSDNEGIPVFRGLLETQVPNPKALPLTSGFPNILFV